MNRLLIALVMASVTVTAALGQSTLYVSPDVATDPDGPATYLPWQVVRHVSGGPAFYGLEFSVPGNPAIDGLHKRDTASSWLFSVEAPNDLAGSLPQAAHPEDIVIADMGSLTFGLFFDGSCVTPPLPPGVNLDALFQTDDNGELFVSFDVPITDGPDTYPPSAVLRWVDVGPGPCDWDLAAPAIDLAGAPTYFPESTRITGLDLVADTLLIAFDIPVDLAPTIGPTTFLPGQIVGLDLPSSVFSLFEDLQAEGTPGWPVNSEVDALSCQANPGRINSPVDQITLGKSGSDLVLYCPGSCSSGAENYGIYAGTIASLRTGVYDHAKIDCTTLLCPGALLFGFGSGDRYFLVVPHNHKEEGSYGESTIGGIPGVRPQAANLADRCAPFANSSECP
jgi:hypothetical protein